MAIKNKLNRFLRKLNVEMHGLGYLQSLKRGAFKNNEFDFFKKLYQSEKIIIFDIGANKGLKIKEFINHFPFSDIYAFEPYQPLYNELKNQFGDNANIHLFNIGISNEKAQKLFNVNKGVDTSSFLLSGKSGLNSDLQVKTLNQLSLPLDTLDSITHEQRINKINILKMDIQGSELNALKGANRLLAERKIDIIFTESYFIQQYIDQPLFYDIASYLLQFNYVLQDIYNPIYGKGKIAWCDAIFVRDDLKC